jgi:hypothetical protein
MKRLLKTIKYIFVGLVSVYLIFIFGGLIVKNQGQSEIDAASIIRDGAKITTDKNGRKIEYFLYGSNVVNSPVVINMHGSGLDGTFEKAIHKSACKDDLGVRGISISLTGVGNSDIKKGRKVIDWASEDLQALLDAENVGIFMKTGHSQGNPHTMAAAYHFVCRAKGLGLNAPSLPTNVTEEIGTAGALANESLKTTEELANPLNAYWFFGLYLYVDLLAPWAPTQTLVSMGKNVDKDTAILEMIRYTFGRSMVKGSASNTWESALDAASLWRFDPREVKTSNTPLPMSIPKNCVFLLIRTIFMKGHSPLLSTT